MKDSRTRRGQAYRRASALGVAGIRCLPAALVLCGTLAGAAPAGEDGGNERRRVLTLHSIDSDRVAATELTLREPRELPAVSRAQAEEVALRHSPGATIQEAVYAEASQGTVGKTLRERPVWVVSVRPPGDVWVRWGGPPGAPKPAVPGTYYLVFVDALTGEFVVAVTE